MEIAPLNLRSVTVMRYMQPLREGGSLPALAAADDGFKYVLKFRGAGQGPKMLVSELLGGEIARKLELPLPEIVFAHLDEAFGRTEGDEEIQDLLKFSEGLNLGLHFLSGSITYDAAVDKVDATLASRIVWLDAFITNVDRTYKNTNMLMWHNELWLIDHGAAFLFHHSWDDWEKSSLSMFPMIKDHVLLPLATELEAADKWAHEHLNATVLQQIVATLPDEWLQTEEGVTPAEKRKVYAAFLENRLNHSQNFVKHAIHARENLL